MLLSSSSFMNLLNGYYIKDGSLIRCYYNGQTANIPEGVVLIEKEAFIKCDKLQNIFLPESLESLKGDVFSNCSSLLNISVSSDNQSFSTLDGMLYNKTQTKLLRCPPNKGGIAKIIDNVTEIDYSAFFKCDKIESIIFPEMLLSLANINLFYCDNLTQVTIPENVTYFPIYGFVKRNNLRFMIYCYPDSPAEEYSITNNYQYGLLNK